jgi:WXXGXW repeat (2 copies)
MTTLFTRSGSFTVLAAFAIVSNGLLTCERAVAQQEPAVEELARGPVHEAFGQPVTFNPQPGVTIDKKPPDPIEELPPEQKPVGENVVWISGYWHWDDQSTNYIWISGFWRAVPPNREWVAGYWSAIGERFQWVSGFWASTEARAVEYLPQPPESLELGPSTEPPTANQVWTPGCWIWRDTRYLWRPGFWIAVSAEWVWVPAHYIWTPRGYVFIPGYWDHALLRRGVVFAPVVFPRGVVVRDFVYTPRIVINLNVVVNHFFTRPAYGHYYFGDYYAADYVRAGIYPWFAFHNSRIGYSPLYTHTVWTVSRQNAQWPAALREHYWTLRREEAARPPSTFAAVQTAARQPNVRQDMLVAQPLSEMVKQRDLPIAFEQVANARRQQFSQSAKEAVKVRQERVKWEQTAPLRVDPKDPKTPVQPKQAVRWEMPKSTPTVVPVVPKDRRPPAEPIAPKQAVETPKAVQRPLPKPEDVLQEPPKTKDQPKKKDPVPKKELPKEQPKMKDPIPKEVPKKEQPKEQPKTKDPPPKPKDPPKIEEPPKKDPPKPKDADKDKPKDKDKDKPKDKDKDKDG